LLFQRLLSSATSGGLGEQTLWTEPQEHNYQREEDEFREGVVRKVRKD
jgi:hypothetical protein